VGVQPLVVWQSSQVFVVDMCDDDFPAAVVPLWQEEHVPVTLAWLNVAGLHALVVWQVPHSADV
jgi:hypothetical protein